MASSRCGFAANLAMLFKERGTFLDRFRFARQAGFQAVEISTPELFDHRPDDVAAVMREEGLKCVLFNMPAGDWAGGDRGLAALPGRRTEFNRSIDVALEYAAQLKCPRVHCLAGITSSDATVDHCYKRNLASAAQVLGAAGVEVLIEPINQRSMPGYYLHSMRQAADIIAALSIVDDIGREKHGSVKLLFDVFHCQIMHGDVSMHLRRYRDIIGHIQIAGVPDRAEPDAHQEVNYPYLFRLLREELKYAGHIGCEYHPRAGTEAGLRWLDAISSE